MNNNNPVIDERQKLINTRAMANSGIFLALCLGAAMLYKVFTTDDPGWEFWALIGASFVSILSRRILGDIDEPKNISGKPLPTGSTKQERLTRRKDYALRSVIFAAACAVMDILLVAFGKTDNADYELAEYLFPTLSKGMTVALSAVIAFGSMFLISFLFDYLIGEFFKVKRYNQMLAALDED